MNIYITGLGSGYEVEHLVRLFYPMAPLTLTPPEDGADCVWAEKRPDKLWAMVRQGGKSQTAEAPLPIPVEEGGETPEFALASLTYDLLRSWTGIRPPWGKMTGVRPVRLVHDKRAAGWTEEEIDDFFLKRFDCSPEKYGMAKAIADLQEPILKVGSAPKTYSLYIGIPFCPSRCSYCSFVSCNLDRDRKLVHGKNAVRPVPAAPRRSVRRPAFHWLECAGQSRQHVRVGTHPGKVRKEHGLLS